MTAVGNNPLNTRTTPGSTRVPPKKASAPPSDNPG